MSGKKDINWANVIRGVLAALAVIGSGAYFIPANAESKDQIKPPVLVDCESRLSSHISTDSVRWFYTEKRMEALEKSMQTMGDNVKTSTEILQREFGRK